MKRPTSTPEDLLMQAAATGDLPRRELVRRGLRAGLGLAAVAALALTPRTGLARATSIPPNCIYVCCDGTCDSWKMCMKCVKWPKDNGLAVARTSASAETGKQGTRKARRGSRRRRSRA